MRPVRYVGGLSLLLALAAAARGQTAPGEATISQAEVEVRSGPSQMFYPTGKLRRGDRVKVVREEEGGWLAISPPPGSFSWINARFLDRAGRQGIVHGDEVPLRVGSELSSAPPRVERFKAKGGTQVVVLDSRQNYDEDGGWVPIAPVPQEVRYIPADAVKAAPAVQASVSGSAPLSPPAPSAGYGAPPAPGTDPLWSQAEQAERAGQTAEAIRLYNELGRKVANTDHNLSIQCYNRSHYLQERLRAPAAAYQPANPCYPYGNADGRLVPSPSAYPYGWYGNCCPAVCQPAAYPSACGPQGQTTACTAPAYKPPTPPPATPPAAPAQAPTAPPAPTAPTSQWSGEGWLRQAPFYLDNRATYVLESIQGYPRLYVTAQPGVNLQSYVGTKVNLFGRLVYRGEIRTYYMTVDQVTPVR